MCSKCKTISVKSGGRGSETREGISKVFGNSGEGGNLGAREITVLKMVTKQSHTNVVIFFQTDLIKTTSPGESVDSLFKLWRFLVLQPITSSTIT